MKRHRTDAVSLAFGAIFLFVAGWWAIGRTIDIGLPAFGWVVALGLILVGALGLAGALRRHPEPVPSRPESADQWTTTDLDDD
jgi:hypothetical protein